MTEIGRRLFLKMTLTGSALAIAVGTGLLTPTRVLASWPGSAFNAKSIDAAISGTYGSGSTTESGDIHINAPRSAENGAVVPVTIGSSMPGTESMSIIIEKNGRPMGAEFKLTPRTRPKISTRIKLAESSKVIAVVKADGKLYSASKEVQVILGGCGG